MAFLQGSMNEKDLLTRGVSEVIDATHLRERIARGDKLRVKFGIDPTGADLHLGHTVNLWKLRQFQDAGHTAVLVIGDYTASIGDPSGKNKTRPQISESEIRENYKQYEKQVRHIVDGKRLEVRYQSEWYKKFTLKDVILLMTSASVSSVLAHETFRDRLAKDEPFSSHEFLYPFLQGYDSVAVEADVELGATEQKFNLLMGRTIQRAFGQDPQDVVMSPYLLGTDGVQKMGKSLSNYIGLRDEANEMFGKIMSIRDGEIFTYFELATPVTSDEIVAMKSSAGDIPTGSVARDLKLQLAKTIVSVFHSESAALSAQEQFLSVFQKGDASSGAREASVSGASSSLADLLVVTHLASSKSEARRAVEAGSVYIDEEKQNNPAFEVALRDGMVVRVGKRNVVRLKLS
ncbi:MAG: tyrosine--tRNA ligase [Candidatus Spechtbacterales bacterium]